MMSEQSSSGTKSLQGPTVRLRPQSSRYELRLATIDDLYDILHMLHMFYKESSYKHLSYDFEKVNHIVTNSLLVNNNEQIIILGTYDNQTVGLISGLVLPAPFSHQKMGVERAWYVHPDHRASRIGFKLLSAFEEWCKLVGCEMIQMSSLRSSNAIVDRVYEGRGFTMVEKTFLKTLHSSLDEPEGS